MTNMNIVDRVVERLKTQPIGDLITEEDLHDIVKEAIPKTFFEKRVTLDRNGYRSEEKPPLIIEIMQKALADHAAKAVEDWMKENPEVVLEYWKKVCDDKLFAYVNAVMDDRATSSVKMVLRTMVQQMNDERTRMGLPMLTVYF